MASGKIFGRFILKGFLGGLWNSVVGDGKSEVEKLRQRESDVFGRIEDKILDETLDYLENNFMSINTREYTVLLEEVKVFYEMKETGEEDSSEKIQKVDRLLGKSIPGSGGNLALK